VGKGIYRGCYRIQTDESTEENIDCSFEKGYDCSGWYPILHTEGKCIRPQKKKKAKAAGKNIRRMCRQLVKVSLEELGFRARFLPASEVPVNAELVKFCAEK